MSKLIRGQMITLFALLTALVVTLAACGGGSSSTGGGGSGTGSSIAGTVSNGVAAVQPAGQQQPLLAALADMLVEPARAAGVPGVTVELYDATGSTLIASTVTDANGRFVFTNLQSATGYTVNVLGQSIPVTTGTGDRVEVQVDNNGTMVTVEVDSNDTEVSGRVDDDRSSDDDDSSADGASADDDSSDGQSNDDDDSSANV